MTSTDCATLSIGIEGTIDPAPTLIYSAPMLGKPYNNPTEK